MLSERFLTRLQDAFPHFYDRVNADAMEDAVRLLKNSGGDLEKALVRARFEGAGRLWWPYVRGAIPKLGNDLRAMEEFSRLVLTVHHVSGHAPATMEDARSRVVSVLRSSLDVERLRRVLGREEKEAAAGAAAGAGVIASMTAVVAPIQSVRAARKWLRFIPPPLRVTLAAVVVAALLSVPFVAGYSAGHHAEREARASRPSPTVKGEDPRIRT